MLSPQVYRQMIQSILPSLPPLDGDTGSAGSSATQQSLQRFIDPHLVATIASAALLRTFLFSYFLVLTFSWWAGKRASLRAAAQRGPRHGLADFFLPDLYVWPLIGSLTLVSVDALLPDRAMPAFSAGLAAIGWNAALIILFLYALQGLGIIQFIFQRRGVGRSLRFFFYLILAILFITPRVNIGVAVALPGFGVSEIWLKYRSRARSRDDDEDHLESGR